MKEKFLPLAAVVLIAGAVFSSGPVISSSKQTASAVAANPCQIEPHDKYTNKHDVEPENAVNTASIMHGNEKVGELTANDPKGVVSVELDKGYAIDLCVFGGKDRLEFDNVSDGFETSPPLQNPGGQTAGVSNFAWLITEKPELEPQDTTLNFQKVVCDSDVDLSEYQNAPDNPAGVDTPVTPLEEGDLPEGCSFDTANWDFELSVDGDESTYTASESVSFNDLFDELGAGAAKLFDAGNQLEVAEVEQEGYDFFALSCHQDALNSDNLEYIFQSEVERFDNIWCRAWNTTEVVVEPEPTVAQFSVTKEVEGDEPVDPFEFTWECTVGFDRPMDFSVMNGVYAYDGSFDLSDGETYESDELMLRKGMELDCEVAETETRGADSVSNSLNGEEVAEFTLEAGQTQEITFTNVFEPEVLADDDEIEEDPTPDAEPEVLGAEAQVVAPKGAVDAGASSSALLGLLSSIALVVAGFATRRFVG